MRWTSMYGDDDGGDARRKQMADQQRSEYDNKFSYLPTVRSQRLQHEIAEMSRSNTYSASGPSSSKDLDATFESLYQESKQFQARRRLMQQVDRERFHLLATDTSNKIADNRVISRLRLKLPVEIDTIIEKEQLVDALRSCGLLAYDRSSCM